MTKLDGKTAPNFINAAAKMKLAQTPLLNDDDIYMKAKNWLNFDPNFILFSLGILQASWISNAR